MSLTRMPGFSADAAMSHMRGGRGALAIDDVDSSRIVPQLAKGDDIGRQCLRLCYCCGRWGSRYCCIGCQLCDIVLSDGILA